MRKIPTVDSWSSQAKAKAREILLEKSPFEVDGGESIGREPREISVKEFTYAGIAGAPLLEVIRAKCLDCCGEQAAEVGKCVLFTCPNWPYRMGVNPFRSRNLSEEALEKLRERGRRLAASRKSP